jgi:phosphate starvation-inducible PhoH-like protein
LIREGRRMSHGDVKAMIRVATQDSKTTLKQVLEPGAPARPRIFGKKNVTPKSTNQRQYMEAIEKHDMAFAVGPGGTGKTYLAVAMAVSALLTKQVDRIILARPAVEAGERLGFLPGTLQQKIDPYMRPLYDALYDMLDADKLERFLEKGIVEVAPLAFHARAHAERFVRDPGRSAKHDQRTNENVPHAPGIQLERRWLPATSRRSTCPPGGVRAWSRRSK